MDEVARRVQAALADVLGEPGLVLDKCGWEKAGTKSVRVSQPVHRAGRRVRRAQPRPFCRARGRAPLSTPDLGRRGGPLHPSAGTAGGAYLLEQTRLSGGIGGALAGTGLVQADWVGGDAAYGNSPALRRAGQQRKQAYVLDVGPGLPL